MGHRERLLEGAKACLAKTGFRGTTARAIVAASGTNLGSIGYHYGSKDQLMAAALVAALGEWGDEVERALKETASVKPARRLEAMFEGLVESFRRNPSAWMAAQEVGGLLQEVPGLRRQLADSYAEGRRELASMLLDIPVESIDEATERTVGSILLALVPGYASQWFLDARAAPSPKEMVVGVRRVASALSGRLPKAT
jgi:AcrR family transcriptional regulator